MSNPALLQGVLPLLVTAFVVFRFAQRELRPRTIKGGILWIRPAILAAVTAYLIWASLAFDPGGSGELFVALAIGAVLGVITGLLVVRYTSFAPAKVPNAVVASGSRTTFIIWLCAFAVRLAARFVIPHGADPRTQLPLNAGLVALAAVAFVVIAWAFHQAIARYAAPAGAL